MSVVIDNKQRPFSADIARITKVRLQSSNCPTILKHEVNNQPEGFQPFISPNNSEKQLILDRPRTATNATKMKFSFLQNVRPLGSPLSGTSIRPLSGAMNSTINFDFLTHIGKTSRGKFQDKSNIKPLKKLNTDQFHSVIYKVKQQKEILEKEINRMEQWHRDFKENNIWNTPQSAIIESIMRQNAKSNPEGSVSKYLQTEKEREELMRATKKNQRPTSSYSNLPRKAGVNINTAKSVKDFFSPDDNYGEVIEEIIGQKSQYYSYNKNKQQITEKINKYVENLENYHTLMHSTKELVGTESSQKSRNFREPKEVSGQSATLEDQGKSISEIVESGEYSEASPDARNKGHGTSNFKAQANSTFPKTSPQSSRPFSAKMAVNTSFAPKDFSNSLVGQANYSPHEIPSAIHTRPQTAKQVRVPVTGTIATGLVAAGEPKQQSVSSVKFVPIMMAGQKIPVEPYNLCLNKSKELAMYGRGFYMKEDRAYSQGELAMRVSKSTKNTQTNTYMISGPSEMKEQDTEHQIARVVQRRVLSSKPRTSAGTQTQTQTQPQTQEASAPIGKLNIDGEYFHSFKGSPKTTASGEKKKINILDSWVSKDAKPGSRSGQDRDLL